MDVLETLLAAPGSQEAMMSDEQAIKPLAMCLFCGNSAMVAKLTQYARLVPPRGWRHAESMHHFCAQLSMFESRLGMCHCLQRCELPILPAATHLNFASEMQLLASVLIFRP